MTEKINEILDNLHNDFPELKGNCKRLEYSKLDCSEMYDCCDCGGNDCGCAYCWSCNSCENCLEERKNG